VSAVYAHFVGVGGAGMSGIAKVLHDRGVVVTGSDMKMSRYAAALAQAGVSVSIGHDAANLGDPEVVVVSSAIPDDNPEVVEARRRGIPVWQRARMLAALAGDRKTIAVAGTHGKTTTSSLTATAFTAMGLDPTFLVGGEVRDAGSNAGCGSGDLYVVEADESDGSFLHLDPYVAIVTNVEADHLDHYAGIEEVVATFREFVGRIRADGTLVVCADDARAVSLASSCPARVVTYGLSDTAEVRCFGLRPHAIGHDFDVAFPEGRVVACSVASPGVHNVVNATGVLACAWALGFDPEAAAAGIAGFGGVKRRFETVAEVDGVWIVDDYAHHPTEVKATLAAARTATDGRVWVLFQPHRYSRTAALSREFGEAFGDADRVVLMDVYSAGEVPVPGVSGHTIVDAVLRHDPRTPLAYFPHRTDIGGYLATRLRSGDLIMTMGAGDVTAMGPEIVRVLTERACDGGTGACR
jgi:UDP-N-acetylmuramate--alanine ligase